MNLVLVEKRNRVAVLTLNDPDRRNAISEEMNADLDAAFDDLEKGDEIGAVVVTGKGPVFCAGAVLDDLIATHEKNENNIRDLSNIYRGFLRVAHSPLATIAAVNGAAVGAGMNMALACDLVIAGESARFDSRFLSIGIHPGGGHTWRLRHATDLSTTKAMVLFQQVLTGIEATNRGLAWKCVEDEKLIETAIDFAQLAATHSPDLLAITKTTIAATHEISTSVDAVQLELLPQLNSLQQTEFQKSIRALKGQIGKRK